MNVYLIRISDRNYGFTVRAIVAKTEAYAKHLAAARCRCYFGQPWAIHKPGHSHAEVIDSCPAVEGRSCFMEHEE